MTETKQISYTEAMFKASAPYMNPYQGTKKRVLFVCSAGLLRSATAAAVYAPKYNTRAAGSADYALIPVSPNLLLWAQEIVFVNEENYNVVNKQFDLSDFPALIRVLNIPDCYEYEEAGLIQDLKDQYEDI